jgi:hypothetical protein
MRKIPLSFGLLTYLDELEYTEAALAADPVAADLAPLFAEEIDGWATLFQRERTARREVVRADAIVAVRDRQLDVPTTRFATAALLAAGNDRGREEFRGFFPSAPSTLVRAPLRKQAERTRDVIVPRIAAQPSSSPLHAYAEPLETAARAALSALTARVKLEGAGAVAASEAREWKEGINRLRTTTRGELLKRQSEQMLGDGWAETFFRAGGRDDDGEEPSPDPSKPVPV